MVPISGLVSRGQCAALQCLHQCFFALPGLFLLLRQLPRVGSSSQQSSLALGWGFVCLACPGLSQHVLRGVLLPAACGLARGHC